jgi:hypothetical protein
MPTGLPNFADHKGGRRSKKLDTVPVKATSSVFLYFCGHTTVCRKTIKDTGQTGGMQSREDWPGFFWEHERET